MLNKIRSKKILNIVFENLKMKKKWKLLKYNEEMRNKLCIKKEYLFEFAIIKILKERFRLDLKDDIDTIKLNISGHPQLYRVVFILYNIKFTRLKELDLSSNSISDILLLKLIKTETLEILNLNNKY